MKKLESVRRKKSLKIAQIAPIIERVPPKKYGGTERVISSLTEELVKRGHKVTLFATGDSKTKANLASVYPRGLREAKFSNLYGLNDLTMVNIGTAYSRQKEFDIIHDHNAPLSIPTANLASTPVVSTFHGAITSTNRALFERFRSPYYVSISKSQQVPAPNVKFAANIYHGLNLKPYPFSNQSKGYLLFVGRFSMEKGPHFAIEAAQYLNKKLIIAAKFDPTIDSLYFEQFIKNKLSNNLIQWVGEVDEKTRNKLMSEALCTLHPVTWREPFGLTIIEAMACGSPVIAFNRGSIPEIIRNGETGFVVEDVPEMIAAIENVKNINRTNCRKHALINFSANRMADDYEALYYKILNKD